MKSIIGVLSNRVTVFGMSVAVGLAIVVAASSAQENAGQRHVKASRKTTDPPVRAEGKLGQDLFLAIDHRDLPGVQSLLKRGADPNSRNGLEFVPLYIAAASHQNDVVKALLSAGA